MHYAGGLVTSANDIGKFISFLLSKGKHNNKVLANKSLIESTYVKQVSAKHKNVEVFDGKGYGLGWRLGRFNRKDVVYHFGSYPGYYSHLSFLPEQKIGVAVFINHEFGMPIANLIANYAYDLYLGNESKLKKHEKTLEKKILKEFNKIKKSRAANKKKRDARSWKLSLPKQNYVGEYQNDIFGTAKITFEDGKNYAELGNLRAECTPYIEEDTMRIELIPGSGMVIEFVIENNNATAISFGGQKFKKVK